MSLIAKHLLESARAPIDRSEVSAEIMSATLYQIAWNVILRVSRDNLMLVAAGVAFYAMTAIFPAIAAFVSIYGIFADAHAVPERLQQYQGLLPQNAFDLLAGALQSFAAKSNSTLNVALVVSIGVALWSAKAGVSSLMTGLNIANETIEERNIVWQQGTALLLTLGGVAFAILAFTAVAVLPAVAPWLAMGDFTAEAIAIGRWPFLALAVCLGLAVIYRFGPCRRQAKWKWITWGAAIATALWLIGSGLFSYYVSRFGSYDKTYGSLAAPVVLLLWFWLSALVVLLGAEIDAELEHGDARHARPLPAGGP